MTQSRSWMILALLLVTGGLLWALAPVITPFAAAAGVAYLTDPIVDRLERVRIRRWQVSRTLAVSLVFLMLTVLFTVALLVVIPALIRQARGLVEQVPLFIDWATGTALPLQVARRQMWYVPRYLLGLLQYKWAFHTRLGSALLCCALSCFHQTNLSLVMKEKDSHKIGSGKQIANFFQAVLVSRQKKRTLAIL